MPVLKNAKHELFAQAVAKGKTKTDAATLAGYKHGRNNAPRLMAINYISARILELQGKVAKRVERSLEVTVERIEREMARIGYSDITDIIKIVNGKMIVTDTDRLPADVTAAICEMKQTKDGVAVKFHNKGSALDMLAKYKGMFKENINLNVTVSLADLVNSSYQTDLPALPAPKTIEHEE
jgi:phage terminase small subunit